MSQRIERFGVIQTAKVVGILYGLLGLVFVPIFLLIAVMAPEGEAFGLGFAIALPVLYGLAGFIFTVLGCWLYNLVAGWVGGIEVELEQPVA